MSAAPPRTLCLFDVDGTLSLARQQIKPETLDVLLGLRASGACAIGFLGGSNLAKILEQLQLAGRASVLDEFDYGFAENGLTAFKAGRALDSQSFIGWLGEERYKQLVKFLLRYISELDLPVMRGTFIEFRNGMINVSPIGRNASIQERIDFEIYDKAHHVRATLIRALEEKFGSWGLTYSIGGQISFDVFPAGWDKTYALRHLDLSQWDAIHFFGDKTYEGGNDYEIFIDKRVQGHTVTSPEDTVAQLQALFSRAS